MGWWMPAFVRRSVSGWPCSAGAWADMFPEAPGSRSAGLRMPVPATGRPPMGRYGPAERPPAAGPPFLPVRSGDSPVHGAFMPAGAMETIPSSGRIRRDSGQGLRTFRRKAFWLKPGSLGGPGIFPCLRASPPSGFPAAPSSWVRDGPSDVRADSGRRRSGFSQNSRIFAENQQPVLRT